MTQVLNTNRMIYITFILKSKKLLIYSKNIFIYFILNQNIEKLGTGGGSMSWIVFDVKIKTLNSLEYANTLLLIWWS